MKRLLNIEEVAKYLAVNHYQVRYLIRTKKLKAYNISIGSQRRHYRVKVEDLEEFLQRSRV